MIFLSDGVFLQLFPTVCSKALVTSPWLIFFFLAQVITFTIFLCSVDCVMHPHPTSLCCPDAKLKSYRFRDGCHTEKTHMHYFFLTNAAHSYSDAGP